jgi:hypothetical protein
MNRLPFSALMSFPSYLCLLTGDVAQYLFSAQCLGDSSTAWVDEEVAAFLAPAGATELGFSDVSARFNGSQRDVATSTMQCFVDCALVAPDSDECQAFWDPATGGADGNCPVNIITLSN